MKLTRLVPKAKKLTASRTAAVETIRPVPAEREAIIEAGLDLVGRGLLVRD